MARFCSSCGAALNEGARFCHVCGAGVGTSTPATLAPGSRLFWMPTAIAIVALLGLVAARSGSVPDSGEDDARSTVSAQPGPPDISQMTPQQQADRLYDKVMLLISEGKTDSAAFFAPMAMGAIEAMGPFDNHRRYDYGLVALVTGSVPIAAAQADTILNERPTHLLGLILAAKAADAKRDAASAAAFRKRLIAAEPSEQAAALPEYQAHANDVTEGLSDARKRQ